MFYLFISGTEISKIPGISAAGANPEVIPLTSPSDADVVQFGFPKSVDCFPMDPSGHPTPAIITRAAVILAAIPVCVVRAGSYLPPAAPYIETGADFGANGAIEPAVPQAKTIYEISRQLARNIARSQKSVTLAESVPGGTTTALLILRALGLDGTVSSAGPENPLNMKEEIWRAAARRVGVKKGELEREPLRAIQEFGDPMQASILGFIAGLPKDTEITLAGGTQMLAVAALLSKIDRSRQPIIATTKYVAQDKNSSFMELAAEIGVRTEIAMLDFSDSPHRGLADYEKGYVKEGVGAGGAVIYAEKLGVPVNMIVKKTNELYSLATDQSDER
jgi:uncharacterized protein (TIGR00303 family)